MHAPAAGRLMAEWLTDGKPSIDLTQLRLERFTQENEIAHETNVI
jgi:glycine/D-amino acid oxidase-like deaminating enzyme